MKNTSISLRSNAASSRLFLLAALFTMLFALKPAKSNAQWTSVMTQVYGSGLYSTFCATPDTVNVTVIGWMTGTAVSGDSCTVYINWGDGTDESIRVRDTTMIMGVFTHVYTIPGIFTQAATVTATSGVSNTWINTMPTVVSEACAPVSGHLYVDNNHNCVRDAGEPPLSWMPVFLVNNAIADTFLAGYSDDTGFYSLDVPVGSYTILANSAYSYSHYWTWLAATPQGDVAPSCPANGVFALTVAAGGTYTQDFADTCSPLTSFDQCVNGYASGHFFPGDTAYVRVFAGNSFWFYDWTCLSLSSTVTLTLDPHLHYAGYSSIPPASVVGNTLTWNVAMTGSFYSFYPLIKVTTDISATLGTVLTNTVSATATTYPDPDMSNNTHAFSSVVLASFDPNEIAVCPQGVGAPGYITNNNMLTYTIHFQNTGTAAARNVTVDDTLSANVDARTLHVLASSSPVDVYTMGNAIRFRFNNINLPDSISDPTGSIGSVTYSVMPKQGLTPGTQIFNIANIFFDYNAGVATNKVVNTIYNGVGVSSVQKSFTASVYPNPADNSFTVTAGEGADFSVAVSDLFGRIVYTGAGSNGHAVVNTKTLAPGIYLVKVTGSNGEEQTVKAIVQH